MLERQAARIGYRTAPGLSERLVFRAFFPIGATAFDPLEDEQRLGQSLMSQLLARMELRQLLETIGLLGPPPAAREEPAEAGPATGQPDRAAPAAGGDPRRAGRCCRRVLRAATRLRRLGDPTLTGAMSL